MMTNARLSTVVAGLTLALTTLLGTGCVRHLVNSKFPPVDTGALVSQAIVESSAALKAMPRPDALASLSASDIQQQLPELITRVEEGLSDVHITFLHQEVRIDFAFNKQFDPVINGQTIPVRLVGEGTVAATGFVDNATRTLRFRPWICANAATCRFRIGKVELLAAKVSSKLLAAALETVLREFADNINNTIGEQQFAIDQKLAADFDPKPVLPKPPFTAVDGQVVTFSRRIDTGVLLIDPHGLHGLVTLVAPPAAAALATGAPLPTFADLERQFRGNVSTNLGPEVDAHWGTTQVVFTKLAFSGVMNDGFSQASAGGIRPLLHGSGAVSYEKVPFTEMTVRADSAPDLRCHENAAQIDCNPTDDCNLNKSCDPGWPCPDCTIRWDFWNSITDCGARVACEADKGRFKAQCEAEKGLFRTECEARKVVKRTACEAEKSARLLGCEANQTWLNDWSDHEFARINGQAEFNDVTASLTVGAVALARDMGEVIAHTRVGASSNVVATFKVDPLNAGHLFCPIGFGGQVRFGLDVVPQDLVLSAKLEKVESTPSGTLKMTMKTASVPLRFTTSQPPIAALLVQNPHVFITCSALAPIATALGLGDVILKQRPPEALMKREFDYTLGEQAFEFEIPLLKVEFGTAPLTLKPVWYPLAVGFIGQGR